MATKVERARDAALKVGEARGLTPTQMAVAIRRDASRFGGSTLAQQLIGENMSRGEYYELATSIYDGPEVHAGALPWWTAIHNARA